MFFGGDSGDSGDKPDNYLKRQRVGISGVVPTMQKRVGTSGDKGGQNDGLSPLVPSGKSSSGDKVQNCNWHEFSGLATLSPLSPLSPRKNIIPVCIGVICDG